MEISKRDIIIGTTAISLVVFATIWTQISMTWSKKACAKITGLERSRGVKVLLIYKKDGKLIQDRVDISYFKYKSLERLQQKECCDIKYSIFWPYNVDIIDSELKAD
ncbi:MAG: hypothetical protein EP305_04240 [Bacteroidetes bacterium]|nr:MAG: hypothetical protein EP305_04240 [Bacteroidota bacterium]